MLNLQRSSNGLINRRNGGRKVSKLTPQTVIVCCTGKDSFHIKVRNKSGCLYFVFIPETVLGTLQLKVHI